MGGFNPLRSDIDVLIVVADEPPLDTATLGDLGDRLITVSSSGRGIELSIVTATAAQRPAAQWPFLLHVTIAPGDTKMVVGGGRGGDPDLLMHYVVVRSAGITVSGEPPARTIGPVARDVVLRYLADELRWAEFNASEAYGVLNAARAGRFLADSVIVSKIAGGRYTIAAGGPTGLLHRAIDVQEGRTEDRPPSAAALRFMRSTRAQLMAVAS